MKGGTITFRLAINIGIYSHLVLVVDVSSCLQQSLNGLSIYVHGEQLSPEEYHHPDEREVSEFLEI